MDDNAARVVGATKATPLKRARRRKILESLKKGSSIYNACQGAGVNPATFWRWRQQNARLNRLVEAILESQITIVEDALYAEALKGNTTAQIFFLTNRASDKWKDRRALVNNINAIKIGDGKRGEREFVGEDRTNEQRLINYLRESTQ